MKHEIEQASKIEWKVANYRDLSPDLESEETKKSKSDSESERQRKKNGTEKCEKRSKKKKIRKNVEKHVHEISFQCCIKRFIYVSKIHGKNN